MRTFAYRHWGSELVLVGDWSAIAAGPTGSETAEIESRLDALQDELWSDSPPQLQPGAALDELMGLDHPLARALIVIYHVIGRQVVDGGQAERLRQTALQVLQQAPIAHVDAESADALLQTGVLKGSDGAYVRSIALALLRDLARAADFPQIAACLDAAECSDGSAGPDGASTARAEEMVEAVAVLSALVQREPTLKTAAGLQERLLRLVRSDGVSALVRIAAMQALLANYPSAELDALLAQVAADAESGEAGWSAALALFQQAPQVQAERLLAVYRRTARPLEFNPLFTQLALAAEEAALRLALRRPDRTAPLIWYDVDGTVFTLCAADGSSPAVPAELLTAEPRSTWRTAPDALRARLLSELAAAEHAAGRALALLTGPAATVTRCEPEEEAWDAAEDPEFAADAESSTADPDASQARTAQEAEPPPAVDFVELARQVLADPPLTRLTAAEVSDGISPPSLPATLLPSSHCAALKLLGDYGMPGDGATLVRCFLAAGRSDSPLGVAAGSALYSYSVRYGQPPANPQLLPYTIALSCEGTGELRREAVLLLGCWPAELTGSTLRELARDPTFAVCCLAERALAAQAFAAGQEPPPVRGEIF